MWLLENLKSHVKAHILFLLDSIALEPCYSKCGPQTNICIILEHVRNAENQAQTYWFRIRI